MSEYYDEQYFEWQQSLGEFGGKEGRSRFQPHIRLSDNVLDFGCGGGYLLNELDCAGKIGIEVNPYARGVAKSFGFEVYETSENVDNQWADVLISNHALEHVDEPLDTLRALRIKLKPNGKAVFYVPCESIRHRYHANNTSFHLYTWSPMSLGNLFTRAGFRVENSVAVYHRWPPYYRQIARVAGWRAFDISCRIYGRLARLITQVELVARPE